MASKKRPFRRAAQPRVLIVYRDPPPGALGTSDNAVAMARCISLTGEVCERVTELSVMFKAFVALEQLISPEYDDEGPERVLPSREELGPLLYTLNAEVLRQLGGLADDTTVLQAQMTVGGSSAL